jgi:membrane-associated phospholipid phosphatase
LSAGSRGRLVRMLRSSWRSLSLLLLLLFSVTNARAEPSLEWNEDWPRFRTSEAIVTGLMLLPIAGALFLYPNPDDNMHGGVLFDDAVRDALVADTKDGRGTAAQYSNLPYLGLLAFPILIDTALVTWGIHGAGDVALEMLAMDLESFAITGAVALTFQKMGRVRPAEKGCATDPDYASKCDDPVALNQSFMSGHTAVAFTGAGLTCAHHRHLPLYGGGAPDVAICVLGLAAATTTGVLRIVSDDHYSTDVLLGVGLGLASGWLLPELLHYGGGAEKKEKASSLLPVFHPEGSTLSAVVAPQLGTGFLGLTLLGGY